MKRTKYPEVNFRVINYIERSAWLGHNMEGGSFFFLRSCLYSFFIVCYRNLVTLVKIQDQESRDSILLWKEHDLEDWTLISCLP